MLEGRSGTLAQLSAVRQDRWLVQRFVFNVCRRVTIFTTFRKFFVSHLVLIALRLTIGDTVVAEYLLCMRANLGRNASAHVLSDFLPIFVVEFDSYKMVRVT